MVRAISGVAIIDSSDHWFFSILVKKIRFIRVEFLADPF
jgi:hypothetical protein